MQCRYCGKPLGLLRKLADQEFCSAAHQKAYAQEQEALVLTRLLEARPSSSMPIEEAAVPEEFVPIPPGPEFVVDGNGHHAEEYLPLEAGFLLEEPYIAAPEYYVRNGVVPVDAAEYSVPVFPAFALPDPPMARYSPGLHSPDCKLTRPFAADPCEFLAVPAIPLSGLAVEPDHIEPAETLPNLQPAIRHLSSRDVESRIGSFEILARTVDRHIQPIPPGKSTVPPALPEKQFQALAPALFALSTDSETAPSLAPRLPLDGPAPRLGGTPDYLAQRVVPSLYTAMKPIRPEERRDISIDPLTATEPIHDEPVRSFSFAAQPEWHSPRLSDHLFSEPLQPNAREAGSVPESGAGHRVSPVRHHRNADSVHAGIGPRPSSYASTSLRGAVEPQAAGLAVAYAWEPIDDGIEPETVTLPAEMPSLELVAKSFAPATLSLVAAPLVAPNTVEAAAAEKAIIAVPAYEPAIADVSIQHTPPPLELALLAPDNTPPFAGLTALNFVIEPAGMPIAAVALEGLIPPSIELSYPGLDEVPPPAPRLAESTEGVLRPARRATQTLKASALPLLTLAAIVKPAEEWSPHLVETLQAVPFTVRSSQPDFLRAALPAELALDEFETIAPRREPVFAHSTSIVAPRLTWATQSAPIEISGVNYESLAVHQPDETAGW